jgi:hypothetical protein
MTIGTLMLSHSTNSKEAGRASDAIQTQFSMGMRLHCGSLYERRSAALDHHLFLRLWVPPLKASKRQPL